MQNTLLGCVYWCLAVWSVLNVHAESLEQLPETEAAALKGLFSITENQSLQSAVNKFRVRSNSEKKESRVIEIDLTDLSWDEKTLSYLKVFPELEVVGIDGNIARHHLDAIGSLHGIKALRLNESRLDSETVACLTKIPFPFFLDLTFSNFRGSLLKDIPQPDKIIGLWLPSSSIAQNDIQTLAKFVNLEHLKIADSEVSDQNLDLLLSFKKLKSLDVSGTKISEAGLRKLIELPDLRFLSIDGLIVSREFAAFARDVKKIQIHGSYSPQ